MNEFQIINHFFNTKNPPSRSDVKLSIGDDCAVVAVPANQQLTITTDTLIEGVHFLKNANPTDIGYKSLAANLSDLAAMGAKPTWFTLALTLPNYDLDWLTSFTHGLFNLAQTYQLELIGGDLNKGDQLTISISAYGFVKKNKFLRRSGAQPNDAIFVTHTLGDAALGLELLKNNNLPISPANKQFLIEKINHPEPQVEMGLKLVDIAHAAIDISDGLTADLGHILEASSVGAIIDVDTVPLSSALKETVSKEKALELALTGGDDYELCFTIANEHIPSLPPFCKKIGKITRQKGLVLMQDNQLYPFTPKGYKHFT